MNCLMTKVLNCFLCLALVMVHVQSQGKITPVRLHSGVYSFDDLVLNNLFVDKTMMIQDFLENKCKVTVITRPRKWGKTVILEMFQRFLDAEVNESGIHIKIALRRNHKLFEGGEIELENKTTKVLKPLKISNDSRSMKQLGMKTVVMLRISSVKGKNYNAIETSLKKEIKNLFLNHGYLKVYTTEESKMLKDEQKRELLRYYSNKQLDYNETVNGLFLLTNLLYQHFGRRVIVLVDDYDLVINNAVENFGENKEDTSKILTLFQNIYKNVVNNFYVEKSIITGTLPFTEDALFLNARKLYVFSVLDMGYSEYFGFFESEVDDLLERTNMSNLTSISKMKYWYKGFLHGVEIRYNPLDIMGYISNQGLLRDYWLDSGRVKSLDNFLMTEEAQEDLQKLLEDEGTVKSLSKYGKEEPKEEGFHLFFGIFYRLLVHHGYLNAFKIENDISNNYLLRIPNQPIRTAFVEHKTKWFCNQHDILLNDLYDFVGCLITSQVDHLKDNLGRIFESFNKTTLKEEKDYHCIMGQILNRLLNHNMIFSGKQFEIGKLYHMIVPRSLYQGHIAFVLEYKMLEYSNSSRSISRQLQILAQSVLDRMDGNVYGPMLVNYKYVDKVITIAIAFWDNLLEIAYKRFKY